MLREIVKIDEELCNGCGMCIPNCHEGALQLIDGKARLISELMCDGLGACLGHCPQGAITIEKREAVPYNEVEVLKEMIDKGENTVIAHLKHLKDHNETGFLQEGMKFLKENRDELDFDLDDVIDEIHGNKPVASSGCATGGCPGSRTIVFDKPADLKFAGVVADQPSQLRQWPVQLHLVNPMAPYFQKADLLIAADCTAFTVGNFHSKWLKDKSLVIACPKLDHGTESYIHKLAVLIDEANVNTITIMMMEVPCCGGLLQMVREAQQMTTRKVPVKAIIVSIRGEILREEWI
ncbi:MAG TPA: 4Fe-4S binding protein [Prolixibacteraceae bacterium]|nr:4Fe-4S binding protein [Prolixibacteraceae bacterium]HPS12441.1 4Fe-4S binding protein [Prolixibacteraceae bacterium]